MKTYNAELRGRWKGTFACPPGLDADARGRKINRVAAQRREAKAGLLVTCACDRTQHYMWMYRCYYCGECYCELCAPDHFGGTREEYKARLASDVRAKLP